MAAVAFLTRVPVGQKIVCNSTDVARSAGWFPLIGILMGGFYSLAATTLTMHLPLAVVSVLLVILDAIATGALHFDGLADTADGLGGGKSSEDILRIMREHAIGSYGGVALVSAIVLKATAYTALLNRSGWVVALILTPALGRWAILLLTATLPYARQSRSVTEGMGKGSLVWGTLSMSVALIASRSLRACIALVVIVSVTALFGLYCRRRIGGITGDTLGANVQLCESAALLTFLWTAAQ